MTAYYNEFDPYAAEWLRNLIREGLIADGAVDDRSIIDVEPADLRGFTQCHFFAGIGGWSLALRYAGWPDDRPVWSGSPPCQPFSAAGRQNGAADERHLWPVYFRLIAQHRPTALFGEQVAAAIGNGWLDAVFADMEGEGYACAAAVLPACSVGAPHLRQRLWFVADSTGPRRDGRRPSEAGNEPGPQQRPERLRDADGRGGLADSNSTGRQQQSERDSDPTQPGREVLPGRDADGRSDLGDTDGPARRDAAQSGRGGHVDGAESAVDVLADSDSDRLQGRGGAERGLVGEDGQTQPRCIPFDHWADLEWLPCADGKARPTQPGIFPLVNGLPEGMDYSRTGTLKAAGNAIVPQVAAAFIGAYADSRP